MSYVQMQTGEGPYVDRNESNLDNTMSSKLGPAIVEAYINFFPWQTRETIQ